MEEGDRRIGAIEERLVEVENAQRDQAAEMRTMFQRIDVRLQALEMNFSLLNAAVTGINARFVALDAKVTELDTKLDQILTLLRSPDGARPY